jgi:flagellar motor protein MotB
MSDPHQKFQSGRGVRALAFIALFSSMLFVGVLSTRTISFKVIGRSDPILWKEFFLFRTGLIWAACLFAGSVFGSLFCGAQMARRNSKVGAYILLALAGSALVSSLLIVVDSMVPGTAVAEVPGVVVRTATTPAPVVRNITKGFSIYFRHGRSEIQDKSTVSSLLHAVSSCGPEDVQITGFVSSAPYATDNEANNVILANARADKVYDLAIVAKLSPHVHHWQPTEFPTVLQGAGYLDQTNGSRKVQVEILNRRVDVSFQCSSMP